MNICQDAHLTMVLEQQWPQQPWSLYTLLAVIYVCTCTKLGCQCAASTE